MLDRAHFRAAGACLAFCFLGCSAAAQGAFDLEKAIDLFGDGFVVSEIRAPIIEEPREWVGRPPGTYVYRFVAGTEDEALQEERHVPDPEGDAWERQIGEELVERFRSTSERDVLIVEEVDHEHGFRVEIEPGVHVPSPIEPGGSWESDAHLTVYDLQSGDLSHRGSVHVLHSYEGAYRVRTPAGEFDAIAIRQDFRFQIGPLRAEDDRLLFLARGVGLVAEEEALRASAMIVFRMKEQRAKVLVSHPAMDGTSPNAAGP